MINPTMPPTGTKAAPIQNIGQLPMTSPRVPMVNAIVMITTRVQAAGVEP